MRVLDPSAGSRLAGGIFMPHASSISTSSTLQWLTLTALLMSPSVSRAAPRLDHVIVVVMENKSYRQASTAPYTASLLAKGSVMTDSYAITHPSQPNYLAL